MWRVAASVVIWLLAISNASAILKGTPYIGPCDLIVCAEGYSAARAMSRTYNGPLFQLYNGTTTLDIGQTTSHVVDLSTWSAFCGGVQSNCKYSKFYAQINTGPNDLIPAVFAGAHSPNCTGGGPYKCAAPFEIEAATGLPVMHMIAPYEYTLVNDNNATNVNGPASSLTIIYNGKGITKSMCCGPFGIGHSYTAPDTIGTDFYMTIGYGQTAGQPTWEQCQSAITYCTGPETESAGDWIDYSTSVINVISAVTFDAGTNYVTASMNGTQILNKTPPAAAFVFNGNTIHFGGGGDLGQPAEAYAREIVVANSAVSLAQQQAVAGSIKAFYSTLVFP